MKFGRMAVLITVLVLLFAAAAGCAGGNSQENSGSQEAAVRDELQQLLPDKAGYKWVYSGFAEYGHSMVLDNINEKEDVVEYMVSGTVDDASGGEAQVDFTLELEYVIEDGILIQKKEEEAMLDSTSDKIELVRAPLEEGNKWVQTVKDEKGKELSLECEISNAEKTKEGLNEYTVNYQDQDSDYFERRTLREGVGTVSFERLWESKEGDSFVIGYTLYEEASGYQEE